MTPEGVAASDILGVGVVSTKRQWDPVSFLMISDGSSSVYMCKIRFQSTYAVAATIPLDM